MKGKLLGLFALLAIGLLVTGGLVAAFGSRGFADTNDMRQAIADGDFQTWKQLHQEQLTEKNFAQEQERYQERQGMMQGREEIQAAIDADDYTAYSALVLKIHPDATVISEDDFTTLVELHQARLDGDVDTWQKLRDEIDFAPGEMARQGRGGFIGHGHEMGRGMAPGMGQGFGDGNGLGLHNGDCLVE